jgi:hypothetical protein
MPTTQKPDRIHIKFLEAAGEPVAVKAGAPLDLVKKQIFAEHRDAFGANEHLLRLALAEADALARPTGFPHLFFPLLAAEKAQNAVRWQLRQQFLLRSNSAYALAA